MVIDGYTQKKFDDIHSCIRNDLIHACSDRQWKEIVLKLFNEEDGGIVQKKGAYKTIVKTTVLDTPCLVKTYRTRGFFKKIKTLFFPSRAFQEFRAAVFIMQKDIPTPAPLFMAELREKGMVRKSLVGFAFLSEACELKDLFFQKEQVSVSQKRDVLSDFGRLTGKIFLHGVFQYDYSLNNFMIQKEGDTHQIFFIDFERVSIKKEILPAQKLELLAKLNRVGREVGLTDRFRFLKGYLEADPRISPQVKSLASMLQKKTISALKKDIKRIRLTSLYTHNTYDRIALKGFTGLVRKGYYPEEIVRKVQTIPEKVDCADVHLTFHGSESRLKAVQYKHDEIREVWAAASTLIIAGAVMALPPVFIDDGTRGFIFIESSSRGFHSVLDDSGQACAAFVRKVFPEELKKVEELMIKAFIKNE